MIVMFNKEKTIESQLVRIDDYFKIQQTIRSNEKAPSLAFGISLKSKRVSKDWNLIEKNLSKTLRTILNNTDKHFQVVIAGHEKPDIPEMLDKQVTWLQVDFDPPTKPKGFSPDKFKKRTVIGTYLRKSGFTGYFMPLDADDWVHYRFVEYIRSQPITDAFVIEKGFMTNIKNQEIWLREDFFKGCGSGAIFYLKNKDFPKFSLKKEVKRKLFRLTLKTHPRILEFLARKNKKCTIIDLPLMTYVFGHGENNSIIKGKKEASRSADYYHTKGEPIDMLFFKHFRV